MHDFSGLMILSDLDGTLFDEHAGIPQRNVDAIRTFCAGGGLFSVATGRVESAVTRLIPNAKELFNAEGVICNGAYLYDFAKSERIGEIFCPAGMGTLLRTLHAAAPGIGIRISSQDGLLAPVWNAKIEQDARQLAPMRLPHLSFDELPPESTWYKAVLRGEPEELDAFREEAGAIAKEITGDTLAFFKSGPDLLEIQPCGASKGSRMGELRACAARRVGIAPEKIRILALGDEENDLSLLQAADIPVAPANATPAVRGVAAYTLCDHNEGVVGALIDGILSGDIHV